MNYARTPNARPTIYYLRPGDLLTLEQVNALDHFTFYWYYDLRVIRSANKENWIVQEIR